MESVIRFKEMTELLEIMGFLSAKRLSKSVVTGLRKIGKTEFLESLVEHGENIINQSEYRSRYIFVYTDLARYQNIEQIREYIAECIQPKVEAPVGDSEVPIPNILRFAHFYGGSRDTSQSLV